MSFATYAAWNVRHECGERSETFIYGNYYVYIYTYLHISIYVYLSYLCICIFFRTVSSSNVYSRASMACFINFLSILLFQCTKKIDVLFPLDLDSHRHGVFYLFHLFFRLYLENDYLNVYFKFYDIMWTSE